MRSSVTATNDDAPPVAAPARLSWLDVMFLTLLPICAWAALDINLINQDEFVDPWIYTGYGQTFESLVRVYGWPYYAIRFPVIFVNTVCCSGEAPVVGYAVLRYFLVLLAGVPLYALAYRHFGRPAAVCAYLFLVANALFLRVLLWDLTPFVSVPAAVAGIAIWLLSDRHRWLGRFVAGALFAASVASHVYTATAIACFLAVEIPFGLADARRRWKLVPDLLSAALGGGAMIALGVVYFRSRAAGFDPSILISQNLFALRAGSAYSASHAQPFSTWATLSTFVYVPPILAGAIAASWRGQPHSSLERRIFSSFLLYCAFYLFHRFVIGSFVLETFYYFGHLTVAIVFAVPLAVALLGRAGGSPAAVAAAFSLGLLLPVVALRVEYQRAIAFLDRSYGNGTRITAFVIVSAVLVALIATRRLPRPAVWAAACLVALSIQSASLVDPAHRCVFTRARERANAQVVTEGDVYRMAVLYARFVARYDNPDGRVFGWYSKSEHGVFSVTFTRLGDAVNDPFEGPSMPEIGKHELDRLADPKLRYVVLLSADPQAIARGKAALERNGARFRLVESRRLGESVYAATADLVEIVRPLP